MTKITISDGVTIIIMPKTINALEVGQTIYKEKTMASGKLVRDIIGFRAGFEYEWDYVPATTITSLITLLRTAELFTVTYFDTDGVDKSGSFYVDYPSFGLFSFKGDVAVWHDCKLSIRAAEVS